MVESEKSIKVEIKNKIFQVLKSNPSWNDTLDINWANIGSFESISELYDSESDNLKQFKKKIFDSYEELFFNETFNDPKDKNIWFYKYFYCLILTDSTKENYSEIKKEFIDYIINLCQKENEFRSLTNI